MPLEFIAVNEQGEEQFRFPGGLDMSTHNDIFKLFPGRLSTLHKIYDFWADVDFDRYEVAELRDDMRKFQKFGGLTEESKPQFAALLAFVDQTLRQGLCIKTDCD